MRRSHATSLLHTSQEGRGLIPNAPPPMSPSTGCVLRGCFENHAELLAKRRTMSRIIASSSVEFVTCFDNFNRLQTARKGAMHDIVNGWFVKQYECGLRVYTHAGQS